MSRKILKSGRFLIDSKLEYVGRTGLIFEGFGVDHVSAKLFPMHGTKIKNWKPLEKFAKFKNNKLL